MYLGVHERDLAATGKAKPDVWKSIGGFFGGIFGTAGDLLGSAVGGLSKALEEPTELGPGVEIKPGEIKVDPMPILLLVGGVIVLGLGAGLLMPAKKETK